MRIAFLTPEYVTEHRNGGGLASYVARMSSALRDAGHVPEVFTLGDDPGVLWHDEVRVERVTPRDTWTLRLAGAHWRSRRLLSGTIRQLRGARALADALERRDEHFDIVQSSDYGITGLYVEPRADRTHLVRCSWSRKLYQRHAGITPTVDTRLLGHLESTCIRRADAAYAPSRFIAAPMSRQTVVPIRVLRPPTMPPPDMGYAKPDGLPARYLIHFGQLCNTKGTDLLADALRIAWQKEPTLKMVWVGKPSASDYVDHLASSWGDDRARVLRLGSTPREKLYAMVQHADAAVLPSRCDNLPNTVIECLSLGVPVIGSDDASIDELVTDGRTGRLVPIGDVEALADAMVEQWRDPIAFVADNRLPTAMEAADALIRLAKPRAAEVAA